jgi:uncharacterized protein YqhQ
MIFVRWVLGTERVPVFDEVFRVFLFVLLLWVVSQMARTERRFRAERLRARRRVAAFTRGGPLEDVDHQRWRDEYRASVEHARQEPGE